MTDVDKRLRDVVRQAAGLPFFSDRYANLELAGDFAFTDVPEMTREDITASMTLASGQSGRAGAYLFTSGGSTAAPKVAWIPIEMHLGAILGHWRPLGPGDVLANLAMPGRLWSAHYFYNGMAERCGADAIGLGHVEAGEWPQWLDFLDTHGTTALCGTPSTLEQVLTLALRLRHPVLRRLRAALFFGEPCPESLVRLCRDRLPGVGLWGNYGSTETWVIGHNGPACDATTFHVFPHQHVEVVDGSVLVTTLHEDAVSPVVRYRIGDRARWTRCACGGDRALRLLGREGALIKFAGTLVAPDDLLDLARADASVAAAQAAWREADPERLEIRVVAAPGATPDVAALRARLLDSQIDLRFALRGEEDAFEVVVTDRLQVNDRTAKTPSLMPLDAPR